MATLGIIGGIAPPSTVEYYRAVVDIYRARTGGRTPRVLVNSLDGDAVYSQLAAGRHENVAALLLEGLQELADGGAQLALLASASVHVAFDRVRVASPLPLVGIVESVVDACGPYKRLGLLATTFTVRADLFGSPLAMHGVTVLAPTDREQEDVHRIYFDELVAGRFRSSSRDRLLQIAFRMRDEEFIDGMLLAGTELPLLLPEQNYDGLPLIDTGRAHVEAAVAAMLTL